MIQIPDQNPSPRRNLVGYLIVAVLFLSIGFSSGLVTDRLIHAADNVVNLPLAGANQDLQLISDARNIIEKNYVEHASLGTNQLIYGAISGMVTSLGDTGHSRFLDPDMLKSESNLNQGEFEGIGAEVEMKDGHVVIVAPMDGSPALKAGVHAGDIILKVDGQDVSEQSLQAVVQLILGPAGTQVTITLLDPNSGEQRDVTITRARIQIHNVTWNILPGTSIAHLRIAAFSNGVSDDLKQALKEIKTQHATGLVLDLRNNPGGLLDEAVVVASQFLKDGSVLQEKNAQGEIKVVLVKPGGLATDIPMEVLINQGTASAAEIVSGAIQDAGRAKLIGQTTFGTGTVLNQFNLPDGSAILLATEKWLTPKGRLIWHQGIAPDLNIELAANTEPLTPEGEKELTLSQLQSSGDSQLLSAIQLLDKVAGEQISTLVH